MTLLVTSYCLTITYDRAGFTYKSLRNHVLKYYAFSSQRAGCVRTLYAPCMSTPLDVGTWTNWLTFEPDLDYSPDAGTGLLSPISYALQHGILWRRENFTYRYWEPIAAVMHGFKMVLFTARTTLSEVRALQRVPFYLWVWLTSQTITVNWHQSVFGFRRSSNASFILDLSHW